MKARKPGQLAVSVTQEQPDLAIKVVGEADMTTAPALLSGLTQLLERASRAASVVVDLAEVAYMDSTGVGTLVEFKRLVERAGRKLMLARPSERVRSVFEVTHLDRFFKVVDDLPPSAAPA